jgi:aromatic ring hydroxylase
MLRTGSDYLEALRDGRRIYVGGELVRDVTSQRSATPRVRSAQSTTASARPNTSML